MGVSVTSSPANYLSAGNGSAENKHKHTEVRRKVKISFTSWPGENYERRLAGCRDSNWFKSKPLRGGVVSSRFVESSEETNSMGLARTDCHRLVMVL